MKKIIISLILILILTFTGCNQINETKINQRELNNSQQIKNFNDCINNKGEIITNPDQCQINKTIYIKNSKKTINLKNCISYYDGCNTCFINNGTIGGCTKMACDPQIQQEPYCKKYKNNKTNKQIKNFNDCVNNKGETSLNSNQCQINKTIYIKNSEKTINLKNCISYYDGCNTCFINNGTIGGCTLMACSPEMQQEPSCKLYEETATGKILKIQNNQIHLIFDDIVEIFNINAKLNLTKFKKSDEVKITYNTDSKGIKSLKNIKITSN